MSYIQNGQFIIVEIDKTAIQGMDYATPLAAITKAEQLYGNPKGRILFSFSGYAHMAEELWELMEVRNWTKGLFQQVPHLLYYVMDEMFGKITLLKQVADVESLYIGEKKAVTPAEYQKMLRQGIEYPVETHLPYELAQDMVVGLAQAGKKYHDIKEAERVVHYIAQFVK